MRCFIATTERRKIFYGGETIILDQYPWGECDVVLDEECPWNKLFYKMQTDLKFKREIDGKVRHKLYYILWQRSHYSLLQSRDDPTPSILGNYRITAILFG